MILHDPTGMPVLVPDTEINSFIARGYRTILPPAPAPIPATTSIQTGAININTASLKELTSLEGVGTATAKKIQSGRPYTDVAELIVQFPEVKWMDLPVTLDAPDTRPEE